MLTPEQLLSIKDRLIRKAGMAWDSYRIDPIGRSAPETEGIWELVRWCDFLMRNPRGVPPQRIAERLQELAT